MALRDVYAKPLASLDDLGGQLAFHLAVLRAVPRSVTRYPREIMRILAEVTLGTGALAVIGGTVGVIIGMTSRDPGFGFTAGLTWVFRGFTVP